jgi:3-methylfumaryl-CoA hydratase
MGRIEAVRVGDALPERRHSPSIVDLFFYNAALWNGHRIHFDSAWASGEGYPGLVIQGPLQGDWMTQSVMEWLGDDGCLLEFEYSNRTPAFLGQTLTVGGRVTEVDPERCEVAFELYVRNENGEIVAPGTARVRLG